MQKGQQQTPLCHCCHSSCLTAEVSGTRGKTELFLACVSKVAPPQGNSETQLFSGTLRRTPQMCRNVPDGLTVKCEARLLRKVKKVQKEAERVAKVRAGIRVDLPCSEPFISAGIGEMFLIRFS